MINDFEKYHGIALRLIVVGSAKSIVIRAHDNFGWINSFILDEKLAIHIKHSTKRLPPWNFSIGLENLSELRELAQDVESVWLVLVCGPDGVVSLPLREFIEVTETRPGGVASIRVDRNRGKMYRVYGNSGRLKHAKPHGVAAIITELST